MKAHLTIGKYTAWAIAVIHFSFAVFQFVIRILKLDFDYSGYTNIYWTTLIISIIIFTNDILLNRVFQKWFWIVSVIILVQITPIFYLIQRNKLIRLGESLQ
jgi:hypothetical protein